MLPGAIPSGSRAITIEASTAEVWPWLTQIGQDRAGFYSYRWLENLFGASMPGIYKLVPDWSLRTVGEKLRMAPEKRFGPIAAMDIVEVEPGHFIVAKNLEGTWSFIVEPINGDRCRLIARGTWVPSKSWIARLMRAMIFDPIHYIMEWKMIRSIKVLSERGHQSRLASGLLQRR